MLHLKSSLMGETPFIIKSKNFLRNFFLNFLQKMRRYAKHLKGRTIRFKSVIKEDVVEID